MNHAACARRLLRAHRYGALCTLSKKLHGFPFGSITPYAVDHDGSLLILISALAEHTKNIQHDSRVSLITHNQHDAAIQMQGRVTVTGHAQHLGSTPHARYLSLFPEAAELLTLDFAFYRIQPVAIRYIGGVGSIHWISMVDYAVAQADAFAEQQSSLLDMINQPDSACRQLLQAGGEADARIVAFDCDGLDVLRHNQIQRIDFSATLTAPEQIRSLSAGNFRQPSA